jgi:hypothetical protein
LDKALQGPLYQVSQLSSNGYSSPDPSGTGPIYIKYSHVFNKTGVGLNFATERLEFISNQDGYTYKEVREETSWQLRLDFHAPIPDSILWKAYIGFGLGYNDLSGKFTSNDPTFNIPYDEGSGLAMEVTLGVRYHFSKYIGAYGELGLAKSLFQFGLCSRF